MALQKDPEETETRFLNQTANLTNQRVLEIGCGDGRLTWRYARSARRIIGIDLDSDALKAARANCPSAFQETVSFMRASSLDLPFPHGTFDRAILAWSF